MSFSQDVKAEIISSQYKSACCRRALLNGILSSKANVIDGSVSFNIETAELAGFASTLIKEFFGKDALVAAPAKGGRCKTVTFDSKAARNYLYEINDKEELICAYKCQYCQMAYLRGVFFATGRVSDPAKQFCLEFSLGNRANMFLEMFNEMGLDFKISNRSSEVLLYTKNSSVIEDFFSLAELNNATFAIMNIKIANDLKNNANRLRNFDTVNISKAVDAANAQTTMIKKLHERGLLGSLPDELEQTAKLRLAHPDMSLTQLAIHSVPPISKSGITHRLSKIMKLGEELLKKSN